jgi:hypothetical protein
VVLVEWWNEFGAYVMGLEGFPALAHDMTHNGPRGDFGYTLTALMNNTATPIDLYPPDEPDFSGLGG